MKKLRYHKMLNHDSAHEGIVLAQHMKKLELTQDVNPTEKHVNPIKEFSPLNISQIGYQGQVEWVGQKMANILADLEVMLSC